MDPSNPHTVYKSFANELAAKFENDDFGGGETLDATPLRALRE